MAMPADAQMTDAFKYSRFFLQGGWVRFCLGKTLHRLLLTVRGNDLHIQPDKAFIKNSVICGVFRCVHNGFDIRE